MKPDINLLQQNTLFIAQQARLDKIEHIIQARQGVANPHLAIVENTMEVHPTAVSSTISPSSTSHEVTRQEKSYGRFSRICRVPLPSWFTKCVWEFGTYEMGIDNFRTIQLRSVMLRPEDSVVFAAVRSGNVDEVRSLLESGALSITDHACDWMFPNQNLLMVSSD
jgi:hypothetical protein